MLLVCIVHSLFNLMTRNIRFWMKFSPCKKLMTGIIHYWMKFSLSTPSHHSIPPLHPSTPSLHPHHSIILLPPLPPTTPTIHPSPSHYPPLPHTSIWSNADHLYDDSPRHWSGPAVNLSGMISIDGELYRFVITLDISPFLYIDVTFL